ncbi:g8546 [Coccomyxa viridis]|uniref:G8546 protein n=1 Tax=Coccomyxa viridis TaxID=1274662 RepID=A0ABP1G0L3_9CHLO
MLQSSLIGGNCARIPISKLQSSRTRHRCVVQAGFGESFKKFSDSLSFENWAPRSSRAWRLGIDIHKEKAESDAAQGLTSAASIDEDSIESLNTRISRAQPVRLPEDLEPSTLPVTEPDDNQLAASLNQRLKELSVSSIDDVTEPCTGETLRALIEEKYGKTYDLSIVRRHIPGKMLVALNVMWTHLGQQSFPMSEEEYMDKLDTIAYYLRAFNQDQVVMDFLRLPAKSQRGLPARPVVGCAVSIRLDLPPAVIEEWFGN